MPKSNDDPSSEEPSLGAIQGPLAGVTVLEMGSFIAGPFAGQLLGDYGAEVIKVEPPGSGDETRQFPPCATASAITS